MRDEILVPERGIDTERVFTYDCAHFDRLTGKCLEYENRPDIWRNTSCVNPGSDLPKDEQHKNMVEETFIKIENVRKFK